MYITLLIHILKVMNKGRAITCSYTDVFFKLYFVHYAITVVPIFPGLPYSTQQLTTPSVNPHTIVHGPGSCL